MKTPRNARFRTPIIRENGLEDGAEIAGVRSSEPEPGLAATGELGVVVTVWHGALPTRTDEGADRSEVVLLCGILRDEVQNVIHRIASIYA